MFFRRILVLAAIATMMGGCIGREKATPIPTPIATRAAVTLPTDTPEPTATATETPVPTAQPTTGASGGPEDAVVQFARIENRRWEPEISAQMAPQFSLQANGFLVYQFNGGPSVDGWYQTVLTASLASKFVRFLVDDIGVLRLAKKRGIPNVRFGTNQDGTAISHAAMGVVYVKTATDEGMLVIPEDELNFPPPGPDFKSISDLKGVLQSVEIWKNAALEPLAPAEQKAIADVLGWWVNERVPYTPTEGAAYGTQAGSSVPADAQTLAWPLDTNLKAQFNKEYGHKPKKLDLKGDEMAAAWRAYRDRPASFWGPLWRAKNSDPAATDRYLISLRPKVPGGNHVEIDYEFFGLRDGE